MRKYSAAEPWNSGRTTRSGVAEADTACALAEIAPPWVSPSWARASITLARQRASPTHGSRPWHRQARLQALVRAPADRGPRLADHLRAVPARRRRVPGGAELSRPAFAGAGPRRLRVRRGSGGRIRLGPLPDH